MVLVGCDCLIWVYFGVIGFTMGIWFNGCLLGDCFAVLLDLNFGLMACLGVVFLVLAW